tara:strand:+ start:431 stop:754 length:324 start_codon:yes stop_codon:yes gene_type:complete
MGMRTKDFTNDNFETEVLKSKKPVLVDFWAEWCGPCKMLTPTIDEISQEYSDKFTIGKVNVDQNSELASQYGIRSIPCLLFFSNGEVQKQIVGAVEKSQIVSELEKL